MNRIFGVLIFISLISCKKDVEQPTETPVPDIIIGRVQEIDVTPVDINTPDKGVFYISMNNTRYKVQFNATSEAESNATLFFDNDTILLDQSREFGNFGQDFISYGPLAENELIVTFNEGAKKIEGFFDTNTSIGGTFGRDLIEQWRTPNDPTKPTEKAKKDLMNFVSRYSDSNGAEPGITPVYLAVTVSRQ